ncbi:unnamed protein product, partial [Owenia fusiformis]
EANHIINCVFVTSIFTWTILKYYMAIKIVQFTWFNLLNVDEIESERNKQISSQIVCFNLQGFLLSFRSCPDPQQFHLLTNSNTCTVKPMYIEHFAERVIYTVVNRVCKDEGCPLETSVH